MTKTYKITAKSRAHGLGIALRSQGSYVRFTKGMVKAADRLDRAAPHTVKKPTDGGGVTKTG